MQEMGISAVDAPTRLVTMRLWFLAPELGYPLINDDHDRPLHPLMGPFLRRYLSRFEDIDDNDDEMDTSTLDRIQTHVCGEGGSGEK